jgi:hypothetical protein
MAPESKLLLVIDMRTHTLAMAQCIAHLNHFGYWMHPERR